MQVPYTNIPNEILNIGLSSGAIHLALYMYSNSEKWEYHNHSVCKKLNISERTLSKYWKELMDNNVISRTRKCINGFANGGFNYEILMTVKNEVLHDRNICGDTVIDKKTKSSHDYPSIMEVWNDFADSFNLSTIILINDDRKKIIDKLFKTYGKDTNDAIVEGLTIASKSKFLLGKSGVDFKISFDWFFKVSNITKVLEGNYK